MDIPGVEILAIPLLGHATGHLGFAIREADNEWLFHVGDAFMELSDLAPNPGRQPLGVVLHHKFMDETPATGAATRTRLREFVQKGGHPIRIVNSHDPGEINLNG